MSALPLLYRGQTALHLNAQCGAVDLGLSEEKTNDEALTENGVDIEDNVQFVLARKQKCRVIITNN